MKEKLGVAVDAGTVEKLRTLAGGERKVGDLLSALTRWLWRERSVLERSSLEDCQLWDAFAAHQIRAMQMRLPTDQTKAALSDEVLTWVIVT